MANFSDSLRNIISNIKDLIVPGSLYIGANGKGNSNIKFYDDNSDTFRDLRWDDDNNYFVVEDNDSNYNKIWHEGNDGKDSGLDADLVHNININIKNDNGTIKDFDGNTLIVPPDTKLDDDGVAIIKSSDASWIKNQCTAWVNFDGTDGTIRDSYNINSVTRDDNGQYTIYFENDMDNSNYVITGIAGDFSGAGRDYNRLISNRNGNKAVDKFDIKVSQSFDGDDQDVEDIQIAVFGGKN